MFYIKWVTYILITIIIIVLLYNTLIAREILIILISIYCLLDCFVWKFTIIQIITLGYNIILNLLRLSKKRKRKINYYVDKGNYYMR